MAKASHMLASPWEGNRELWVLVWYCRNDRAVIKGQVFPLPKAAYVSQPSRWGRVGREPRAQGFLLLSELGGCLHLAPGLGPSSRLQMRVSHRPDTPWVVSPSCAPLNLSPSPSLSLCQVPQPASSANSSSLCILSYRVGRWLPCASQMGGRDGSWEVCLLSEGEASALTLFPWGEGCFQLSEASAWVTFGCMWRFSDADILAIGKDGGDKQENQVPHDSIV